MKNLEKEISKLNQKDQEKVNPLIFELTLVSINPRRMWHKKNNINSISHNSQNIYRKFYKNLSLLLTDEVL